MNINLSELIRLAFADFFSRGNLLAFSLIGAIVIIMYLLSHRDKDDGSKIDLDQLLMEYNPVSRKWEMSKTAALAFASFALTSWIMVWLTVNKLMTDILFGAFLAAWVAPIITQLLKSDSKLSEDKLRQMIADVVRVEMATVQTQVAAAVVGAAAGAASPPAASTTTTSTTTTTTPGASVPATGAVAAVVAAALHPATETQTEPPATEDLTAQEEPKKDA